MSHRLEPPTVFKVVLRRVSIILIINNKEHVMHGIPGLQSTLERCGNVITPILQIRKLRHRVVQVNAF